MDTRTPHWRSLVLPLGFVLVCVVAALSLWRLFGGTVPLQASGYQVTFALPQTSNLAANADVRIAGVNVGKVRRLRRTTSAILVTTEFDSRYAPVRSGARALLRTKSLLGESYMEIQP